MDKCVYCKEEHDDCFVYHKDSDIQVGRFLPDGLYILKDGDHICYDCLVVRKPLKEK